MKLWGYYAFHTFINAIKKMFRSTVIVVIAVSLGIGLIFGVSIGIIGSVIEDNINDSTEMSSESEEYDTEEGFFDEDGNFYYHEESYLDENGEVIFYDEIDVSLTDEEEGQIKLAVESGATLLVLFLLLFGAYSGTKKGSDIFMMPDVNFLISAVPFKLYASDDTNDPLYGSWVFNESAVVPTVGGVSREEYTMLNFKGSISDYGYVIDFDVNFGGTLYHASFGKLDAVQTWEASFTATATVVMNPGENSMVQEDEFTISFAQANLSKQVVDITLAGLKFVEQMPEITMEFKNVPFSYSEDGAQRLFNVATITPTVGGEAVAEYTISDFTGSVSKSSVMLDCDIAMMNAHVSVAGSTKK